MFGSVLQHSRNSTLSLMHGNCVSFFRRDYTFNGAAKMNADLSQWSVENLKSMVRTFDGATRFSGKGLEQWDVSQVDDFTGIFSTTFTPCTQRKIANSWGAQSLRVSLSKLEAWSTKTCPPLTDADFKTATCECYCVRISAVHSTCTRFHNMQLFLSTTRCFVPHTVHARSS